MRTGHPRVDSISVMGVALQIALQIVSSKLRTYACICSISVCRSRICFAVREFCRSKKTVIKVHHVRFKTQIVDRLTEYFQNTLQLQIANQVTYHFADHENSLQIKQSTRNKQIADLLAKQIATTIQKWFLTQILPHI